MATSRFPAFVISLALLSACTLTVKLQPGAEEEKTAPVPVAEEKKEELVPEVKEEAAAEKNDEIPVPEEKAAEPAPTTEGEGAAEGVAGTDTQAESEVAAEAAEPGATPRVIKLAAENWQFTPNAVSAKQGEKVTLELTGVSGTHGFSVPELGINVTVIEGQTVTVELPTDKTGTYELFCSIPCGEGHKDMKGTVVIE